MNHVSKKKLLYLMHEPDYFFMHWLHIARDAAEHGFEVHLAAPPRGKYEEIIAHGIVFHPIRMNRREGLPWQELGTIIDCYRTIRKVNPDIVHTIAVKSILYGGLAARLAGAQALVCAFTGLGYVFTSETHKAKFLKIMLSTGYRYVFKHERCRVTFQNSDDLDYMVNAGIIRKQRTALIRGAGVDIHRFVPTEEQPGDVVVTVPSRMLRDKGIQEFVDAASILRNEGVAARFVLVGDTDTGNPTSIPEDILHAWHSSGLVEWTGYQSDMPAVYARSHIVCLPSYREGLPTVLCEASSCGRPVVTTDVPGCREVVRDGVNGFIVPAKNATALACALRRLILDRTLRANMGKMARQIAVADFSTDTVIESTQRLYGEV